VKRVVITGMGTINPIGHNVNETWESIKNKECGIQEISLIDSSTYKTKFDAEIKNYDPNEFFDPKTAQSLRDNILSRGGTEHPMTHYKRFRGQEPTINALLERNGIKRKA